MPSDKAQPGCSCRVTGPAYEQTQFDPACPFHGDNGTMVYDPTSRPAKSRDHHGEPS